MPELLIRGRPGRRTRVRTCVAGLVAAVAVLTMLATPAWAHDELLSTTPAGGANVAAVPAQVVLTFAEPPLALGMAVQVDGPDGQDRAAGGPAVSGSTVRQSIRAGAPAGRYTVHWRVTADDGHPVSGTFTFTATAAGGSSAGAAGAPPAAGSVLAGTRSSGALWGLGAALLAAVAVAAAVIGLRRRRPATAGRVLEHGPLDD